MPYYSRLDRLEGFLHEFTGRQRNRVYRADEILKAIEEKVEE